MMNVLLIFQFGLLLVVGLFSVQVASFTTITRNSRLLPSMINYIRIFAAAAWILLTVFILSLEISNNCSYCLTGFLEIKELE